MTMSNFADVQHDVILPAVHKKTGNIYFILRHVTNCTNAQDGQEMILYMNKEGRLFVRDSDEFFEKFTCNCDIVPVVIKEI